MVEKSAKSIKTRQAILELLKRQGPQSAQSLADRLSLTPMAVRQHLYDLFDQKLVSQESVSPQPESKTRGSGTEPPKSGRQVGRPVRSWRLTAEANRLFPDRHADLAVELITTIRSTFGEEALDRLIARRSESQVHSYRAAMQGARTLQEKLTALARIRSEEGYMAEVLADGPDGYLFIENHCPVCAAAMSCTGICSAELSVFRAVLGPNVELERCEHLLGGARRCAYRASSRCVT